MVVQEREGGRERGREGGREGRYHLGGEGDLGVAVEAQETGQLLLEGQNLGREGGREAEARRSERREGGRMGGGEGTCLTFSVLSNWPSDARFKKPRYSRSRRLRFCRNCIAGRYDGMSRPMTHGPVSLRGREGGREGRRRKGRGIEWVWIKGGRIKRGGGKEGGGQGGSEGGGEGGREGGRGGRKDGWGDRGGDGEGVCAREDDR